jgi:hypothetical protein
MQSGQGVMIEMAQGNEESGVQTAEYQWKTSRFLGRDYIEIMACVSPFCRSQNLAKQKRANLGLFHDCPPAPKASYGQRVNGTTL